MFEVKTTLNELRKRPTEFLIVHYSSQSLFDEVEEAFSPRITSIVVMFFSSRQTVNFSLHSIAEELEIPRLEVEVNYDRIEKELLSRFYGFAQQHFEKCWLHWNMRNTVLDLNISNIVIVSSARKTLQLYRLTAGSIFRTCWNTSMDLIMRPIQECWS